MDNTTQHNTASLNPARKDIYQQTTDTILRLLESGTVPWQKPWIDDGCAFAMPRNYTTGRHYNGINILLLWSSMFEQKFTTCEWASFKQWQAKKESIRKGEKGTLIVFCDTFEKEVDGEVKDIPFLKSSVVFNRCQLAGYDPKQIKPANEALSLVEKINVVDDFITNTEATVIHSGSLAYYCPSTDTIYLPAPDHFQASTTCSATESYYFTLLHELTHWTGSTKRLDRIKGKRFGDEDYAIEELVAELGSAFLCAQFDICAAVHDDHAAYIAHWLKALKENKQFIFKAASEASKAVEYLQTLQPKA